MMCNPAMSRYYWPPNDQVKAWLEPHWDEWVAAPPQWLTPCFVRRVTAEAPPEVLPLAVLQDLAEKHSGRGMGREDDGRQLSVSASSSRQPSSRQFATTSRDATISREQLVKMEVNRRANKTFARSKQVGIWMVALAFSYIDLGTTVMVGREYLSIYGDCRGDACCPCDFWDAGGVIGDTGLGDTFDR